MNTYLAYTIGTISAILPVIFIKEYLISKEIIYLLISLICYLFLIMSYLNIFKDNVSTSYTIIQILQIIIVIISGILFFKESLTKNQILGIVLGLVSIYFLMKK